MNICWLSIKPWHWKENMHIQNKLWYQTYRKFWNANNYLGQKVERICVKVLSKWMDKYPIMQGGVEKNEGNSVVW